MPHPSALTTYYLIGVLRVASKYQFTHAVDWTVNTLRTSWSTKAQPWLQTLPSPSEGILAEAVALINISREIHRDEFLGHAFYLLCTDEKTCGDNRIYGLLRFDDLLVLIKGVQCLRSSWAGELRSSPTHTSIPATSMFGPSPAPQPNVFGQSTGVKTSRATTISWGEFVCRPSTMASVFKRMGLIFTTD